MGNDVIIGYDGKPRCPWAGPIDTALGRYHDEVGGKRTYDEPAMFEAGRGVWLLADGPVAQ
jgi:DNA-3-methyladenine glycosylase I